jgi:hypothetical protein
MMTEVSLTSSLPDSAYGMRPRRVAALRKDKSLGKANEQHISTVEKSVRLRCFFWSLVFPGFALGACGLAGAACALLVRADDRLCCGGARSMHWRFECEECVSEAVV